VVWAKDVADNKVKGFIVPISTPGYSAERIEGSGAIYVEADRLLQPDVAPLAALPGWHVHRADKAGQVHYHLLLPTPRPPGA
jgi:hypothetical protein